MYNKSRASKESARYSVNFPTPSDYLIVIYLLQDSHRPRQSATKPLFHLWMLEHTSWTWRGDVTRTCALLVRK